MADKDAHYFEDGVARGGADFGSQGVTGAATPITAAVSSQAQPRGATGDQTIQLCAERLAIDKYEWRAELYA